MALIVEDGSGKSDAESYCTVAFATAYHAARGNAAWAALADDATRESLLRKATDYMLQTYRLRWSGYRVTATQALDWPRSWVVRPDLTSAAMGGYAPTSYLASDVVPVEVQKACAELALRASTIDLAPDVARVKTREKIDVLEFEYSEGSPAYTQFRAVDNLLVGYFGGSAMGSAKVVRA